MPDEKEEIQEVQKDPHDEAHVDIQDAILEPAPTIKTRPEFSKIIAAIGIIMWLTVNVYGMVLMAVTLDLSPLVYVIASVDAVVAIIYTNYSIKAKAENMIKLKKIYGYDAESVIDAILRPQKEDYED